MAKQVINIGSVANDGTGDPLRTAFDKVNDNFTELYNDDSGDVDSVNGQTGTVVLDTDDISEGASNLYNATHTGEVTGSTALTIASNAVTYEKLGAEFTETTAFTTNIDFSLANTFTQTITGNTSVTFSFAQIGMVKDIIVTGDFNLTFTSGTINLISGTYDGTVENLIQVVCTAPNVYWMTISQPTV